MVLAKRDIEYKFAQGINSKIADKSRQNPLLLENACFDSVGALNKRNGLHWLTNNMPSTSTPLNVVDVRGNPNLIIQRSSGPSELVSYNSVQDSFEDRGFASQFRIEMDKTILGSTLPSAIVRNTDICVNTQIIYYIVQTGSDTDLQYASITSVSVANGQVLESGICNQNLINHKMFNCGTTNIILARADLAPGVGAIYYGIVALNETNVTWGGMVSLIAAPTTAPYEAIYASYLTSRILLIAYLDTAGGHVGHINIALYNVLTDTIDSTIDTGVTADNGSAIGLGLNSTGNLLTILFKDAGTNEARVMTYNWYTAVQTVAPSTVLSLGAAGVEMTKAIVGQNKMSTGDATTNSLLVFSYQPAGGVPTTMVTPYHDVSGTVSTAYQVWLPYTRIASRPAVMYGTTYFWLWEMQGGTAYGANTQPGFYLTSFQFHPALSNKIGFTATNWMTQTHAAVLYGSGLEVQPDAYETGCLPNMIPYEYSSVLKISGLRCLLPWETNSSYDEAYVASVNAIRSVFYTKTMVDDEILISGGFLGSISNTSIVDNGFLQRPVIDGYSAGGAGTGSMSDGVYSIVVVAEYTDENGLFHRSSPSDPEQQTLSAGGNTQSINVTIRRQYLGDAMKAMTTKYVVYRTLNAGTTYYYAGVYTTMPHPSGAVTATVTAICTASDATIAAYEILYTTGGIPGNYPTPSPRAVVASNDRVFVLNSEVPSEVWFSKPKVAGYASQFYAGGIIKFPEDLECIYWYGGRLFAMSKKKIYSIYGEGPSESGQGGQFSLPDVVSDSIGCENQASIVGTPNGLIFQGGIPILPVPLAANTSGTGFWILRDSVSPVMELNSYKNTAIIGSSIYQSQNLVLLSMFGTTGSAYMLSFDFMVGQWGTWLTKNADSIFLFPVQIVNDLYVLGVSYTLPTTASKLLKMNKSSFIDQTSVAAYAAVPMKIRTPWFLTQENQSGLGRLYWFYLVGSYKSAHLLYANVYVDFSTGSISTSYQESISSSPDIYLLRGFFGKRVTSFMLEFYDVPSGSSYESFSVDSVRFDVGSYAPGKKNLQPSGRTF